MCTLWRAFFQLQVKRGAIECKGFVGSQSTKIDDAEEKKHFPVRYGLAFLGSQIGHAEDIEQYLK